MALSFTLFRQSSKIHQHKKTTTRPNIPSLLPILTPEKLLQSHGHHIKTIDELAGVSKIYFDRFYSEAIHRFARFVQQLPASEVHHHAGPGGMLAHGLEVCVSALKIRRSYLLSASRGAEEISKKQDLWTFAVFASALCHDLAKPVVDQTVLIYAENNDKALLWDPWSKFIDEQGIWYKSTFVRHRHYRLHEKASPLLVHRIIPYCGLTWLASDQSIFSQWLASISGDKENAGSIGEIINKADSLSVANNLGADTARMPSVKSKPLHEKMLTALRYLLLEGRLPLNRNGAAGWVKGNDCWLVSKRTVDAIREQLTEEGHTGVPSKNGRLFDELQEHRILIPFGKKAIWRAKIAGEDWEHELTLIRVPVSRIWTHPENRPEEFSGEIIPQKETEADDPASESRDQKPLLDFTTSGEATLDADSESRLNLQKPTLAENKEDQFIRTSKINSVAFPDLPEIKYTELKSSGPNDSAEHFIAWIQAGIRSGMIKLNQPRARVHVVEEGVLLVTPGIFQDYAKAQDQEQWITVQKAVLKRNWHVKESHGLNIMKYQVNGKEKKTTVNGILFVDTRLFFDVNEPPHPNPHLAVLKE